MNRIVEIIRLSPLTDPHQMGVLRIDGIPRLVTLELPWKNNERDVSCIPLGAYKAKRVFDVSLRSGWRIPITFDVNVPGRSGILFHPGNKTQDTLGCILVGKNFAKDSIENSVRAFSEFCKELSQCIELDLFVSQCSPAAAS